MQNTVAHTNPTPPARKSGRPTVAIATVGLPDLRAGGVGLVCATVFCMPSLDGKPGYRTPDEAAAEGDRHLRWYADQEAAGNFKFVRTAGELPRVSDAGPAPLKSIL